MSNPHGDFIWYELMTSDIGASADFYGAVVGWQCRAFDTTPGSYRIFGIGGTDVAGLMTVPAEAAGRGARPGWLGYVGVDNVDAAAADIVKAGGVQHVPPTDIPGVGRFAMLADPQGAKFYVMRGSMEGSSTSFSPTKTGHCHWNELTTSDQAAALAFYRGRFGWEKGDAMPMGEMGDYQFITHHGQTIGAVMRGRPDGPPPMWTSYFGVEDIDTATQAARKKGAAIHYGPAEVPGGVFIIVASDPQGAIFGLVGKRKR
jgi:uncharacterized protein